MKIIVTIILAVIFITGCVNLTGVDGQQANIYTDPDTREMGLMQQVDYSILEIEVLGSIYESGELVSVFVTCLDGNQRPVPNVEAQLSAWYPNGTIDFYGFQMQEIQPSYFLYTGPMNSVQGTYLTQATCYIPNTTIEAIAFGEWQNPFWVSRINQTQAAVQNVTIQIGALETTIEDGFQITWDSLDKINATMNNFTIVLGEVAAIANASVDRNDSYLAQLLLNINQSIANIGVPGSSGTLVNWTEQADQPFFWEIWNIRVDTYSPTTGKRVFYPDVGCSITTTLAGGPIPMNPIGNQFRYSEFINQVGTFNWNVSCSYN